MTAMQSSRAAETGLPPEDIDLVATWLDADRVRFAAGISAGLLAGILALAVAGVMSVAGGQQFTYPAKLMATFLLGWDATDLNAGIGTVLTGFVIFEVVSAFWGFIYGHFVKTNNLGSLLAMGAVFGFFSWVFEWNLFLHSVRPILYSGVGAGPAFLVCMVYGVALTSVAFFDRAFR
jgi:vacuolar-type H+-ATPase subunit I/STV1